MRDAEGAFVWLHARRGRCRWFGCDTLGVSLGTESLTTLLESFVPHPLPPGRTHPPARSAPAPRPVDDATRLSMVAFQPINNGEDAGPSGPVVTWSGYTCDYDMRLACQVTFGLDRGVLGTKRLKVTNKKVTTTPNGRDGWAARGGRRGIFGGGGGTTQHLRRSRLAALPPSACVSRHRRAPLWADDRVAAGMGR